MVVEFIVVVINNNNSSRSSRCYNSNGSRTLFVVVEVFSRTRNSLLVVSCCS